MAKLPSNLKVALVHDYLNDFGGAERVLRVLADMFPNAPIYTAFRRPDSSAAQAFSDRQIIEWRHAWLIRHKNLHSPFRFLIPWIWESFDFSDYDLVISSASGYVTKGLIISTNTKHLCYCHTPPRFLYGYPTARSWQKYAPVRWYGDYLIKRLRPYDYWAAQRPDYFIANSKEVQHRITKFYRRDSTVIYPPIDVADLRKNAQATSSSQNAERSEQYPAPIESSKSETNSDRIPDQVLDDDISEPYYLIVARLVGTKGLELALQAQQKLGFNLHIVGEAVGREWQNQTSGGGVTWLGRVSDTELAHQYAHAIAFLALAENEDFGMTLVEAQSLGTPVIAHNSGGYKETVIPDKTGILFNDYSVTGLTAAISDFTTKKFNPATIRKNADRFSRAQFESQLTDFISTHIK